MDESRLYLKLLPLPKEEIMNAELEIQNVLLCYSKQAPAKKRLFARYITKGFIVQMAHS